MYLWDQKNSALTEVCQKTCTNAMVCITSKWDQQKTRVIPKIALIEAALNRGLTVTEE